MKKEAIQDDTNVSTPEAQATSQETVQHSTQGSKDANQKSGLMVGLSVLALFLLGTAGFLAYQNYQLKTQLTSLPGVIKTPETPSSAPTTDPTANWKTHASTLGFTLKYPSEYKPPEETENYFTLTSPLNPNRGEGYELQYDELKIEIVTEAAKENDSPLKCWNDHNADGGKILNQSEIDIGGTNTAIIDWEELGTGQFICVTHNSKRYLINKYPLVTARQDEFNQILSTFSFL